MRATTTLSLLSLAVVSALALSGCSSEAGAGGGKLKYEDSPLAKYTMALYGDMDQEAFDAETAAIDKLIAVCMKDEGFEYLPGSQGGSVMVTSDDMEDRETEEWVASNGYGMFQSQEEMMAQQSESEEYIDPNADYIASLSESESSAYYETLYGPGPSEEELAAMEEGDGSYEYNWETAGCMGTAGHEVRGEDAYSDPKYKALFDNMNLLYSKIQDQPKMKELDKKWSSCMADAGHTEFPTKSSVFEKLNEEQNAYYETQEFDDQGTPLNVDDAKLAELKAMEIDVALADFKCSEKFDYAQQSLKAQFELETQFVEDNKSELDALLAEYAKGK